MTLICSATGKNEFASGSFDVLSLTNANLLQMSDTFNFNENVQINMLFFFSFMTNTSSRVACTLRNEWI